MAAVMPRKRKGKKASRGWTFSLALGFAVGVAAGLSLCSKAPPMSGLG